jgi:hypothetical protein
MIFPWWYRDKIDMQTKPNMWDYSETPIVDFKPTADTSTVESLTAKMDQIIDRLDKIENLLKEKCDDKSTENR